MSDNHESLGTCRPASPSDSLVSGDARREIEDVLSAFRQWLLESEQWRDLQAAPVDEARSIEAPVDLHSVLREWIALKQEFHLEAKGSKASREELDRVQQETGRLLEPLVRERDRLRDELAGQRETQERGWVELVLDLREALARGAETTQNSRARLGWRARLLPRNLFGGILEGYALALRRIDAALESRGIRPIESDGRPVDPERMRVVDLIQRDDLPAGHVAETLRRGYVQGKRIIRCAEVQAVAAPQEMTKSE